MGLPFNFLGVCWCFFMLRAQGLFVDKSRVFGHLRVLKICAGSRVYFAGQGDFVISQVRVVNPLNPQP